MWKTAIVDVEVRVILLHDGMGENFKRRPTMPATQFSLPKQWEDWCNWLLGIWLCISPWALEYDLEATATKTAVISGILVILAELVTLSIFQSWEEWISVILGAWLIVCPWIIGISASSVRANFIVVGALIMALSFYEIWDAHRQGAAKP